MNEAQVKHFILVERKKGTSIEELIFILHDNGVPEYEISNYLEISIKYVEEILSYCLNNNQFRHIDETNNGKRADWIINIGQYKFIVEQKSTLSLLGIKQNQPDIVSMKQYILKTWGEAIRQLSETQIALNIEKPIKIILLYEDYYKAECLDELFKLDCDLKNDNN